MIKTLHEIRDGLRRQNASAIARDTGIHRNTLRMIRDGKHANPSYATLAKLSEWLDRAEAQ